MPAVTVENILTLPRVAAPSLEAHPRPIRSVTIAPRGFEGDGFPVRRAFHGVDLALLDPFVHLDQMGEVEYAPGEPKGTPWHPHRGFETVTYMIDGTFEHQDSHGGGGVITNGDTQWMTAGAGILHIEKPPEWLVTAGGLFHGFQLWVNLPASAKFIAPKYQDIRASSVALLASRDGGALIRIVAGALPGEHDLHRGPGVTHTPIVMAHVTMQPGARLDLPWPTDFNALAYVLNGNGIFGGAGIEGSGVEAARGRGGQLVVFGPGDTLSAVADPSMDGPAPTLDLLLLGGQPIGEPVAWYGPFVMNTHAELAQAFSDYKHGRLGQIPADAI
ncbi:MAG: pirin family protein [Dehalococcoidia bacterium]